MKKNFTEIEEIIENRITVLEKEYDLDRWDIQEIRTEAYRENGWKRSSKTASPCLKKNTTSTAGTSRRSGRKPTGKTDGRDHRKPHHRA